MGALWPLPSLWYILSGNTPYRGVCESHFVQTDFLGTSKRVCVLSSQNDPLPRIMNRILSLTGECVCYFIQTDLLYDISSRKYPLTGAFYVIFHQHTWGHFIRKVPLPGALWPLPPRWDILSGKYPLRGHVCFSFRTNRLFGDIHACVCVQGSH